MTPDQRALTARDILVDDPTAAPDAIRSALGSEELTESLPTHLKTLTATAARFILTEAVDAIDAFLAALKVHDMLLGGWTQLSEIQTAIEATNTNGGTRHVTLSHHQIASSHSPSLELMVNEAPVPLIDLHLDVTLELDACELVVVEGRVDRIEAGTVAAKGELRTASRTILSHEPTALDLRKLFVVEDPDPATTGTPVRQW